MKFTDLGLNDAILRAISDQGYTQPTPIQEQAIPAVLLGKDIMAAAQTGTGKTASFTLPMLNRLLPRANSSVSPARHPVRALILAPTRELAAQVEDSAKGYGKHLSLRVGSVYGGVPIDPQVAMLRSGVEILVATPGRLLDHVQAKNIRFNSVEFLVLDEADRMLDMGFLPDIKRIVDLIPQGRQTLLFSATYSEEIRKLASDWLKNPIKIEVAPRNTVTETIRHSVLEVSERDKLRILVDLIKNGEVTQVLIFCNTKLGANRLSKHLQNKDLSAEAIHSDRSQLERTEALDNFKSGKTLVLVATDIAARGLDIEQLPFVINFDIPHNPEDYVHRIGRTGRAGQKGEAISFCSVGDRDSIKDIEKLIKIKLEKRNGSIDKHTTDSKQKISFSEDSFFSKPYIPTDESVETKINKSTNLERNNRRADKPTKPNTTIAALLRPKKKSSS